MVKASRWVIMLISLVAVPLLKNLLPALKEAAAKTDTPFDDSLVGAFEVVISALEGGAIFTEK